MDPIREGLVGRSGSSSSRLSAFRPPGSAASSTRSSPVSSRIIESQLLRGESGSDRVHPCALPGQLAFPLCTDVSGGSQALLPSIRPTHAAPMMPARTLPLSALQGSGNGSMHGSSGSGSARNSSGYTGGMASAATSGAATPRADSASEPKKTLGVRLRSFLGRR